MAVKLIFETTEGICEAVESAVAICQELHHDMDHWTKGMETNKYNRNWLKNPKYIASKNATYDLANVLTNLEDVYIPDDIEGEEVTFTENLVRGKYGSRAKCATNAAARLEAVRELLEFLECDTGKLSDVVSILELVEFPTSFTGHI